MSSGTADAQGPEDGPRHGTGWRPDGAWRRTLLLLTILGAALVLAAALLRGLTPWPRILLGTVGLAVGWPGQSRTVAARCRRAPSRTTG